MKIAKIDYCAVNVGSSVFSSSVFKRFNSVFYKLFETDYFALQKNELSLGFIVVYLQQTYVSTLD